MKLPITIFEITQKPLLIKVKTLTFLKKLFDLLHQKSLENHLKSSFRFEDIMVFVMTFWSCRENGLIVKLRLT